MDLNLKNKEWKEFLVLSLFKIERGKRLVIPKRIKGNIPLVTAGFQNSGIAEFIQNEEQKSHSNAVTIDMFGNSFYREYEFKCDDNIHVLKNNSLNRFNGNFIANCFNQTTQNIFSYGKQFRLKTLEKLKILLPINEKDEPDFEFMEKYMRAKEQELLNKYTIHISLKTNELHRGGVIPLIEKQWGEFFIEDVVEILSGRDIYGEERIVGNTPYISATANNNGIGHFVGNNNLTKESGCLSVNRNGSVGYSFYHPYEALFSNDCRKLRLKESNKHIGIFISQQITRQRGKYGYGYKMGTARLKRQKIMLPITDTNEPDYHFMENFMKQLEYKKLNEYLMRKTNRKAIA